MLAYIKNNFNYLSILFFLLPFLFLTGPFLTEIFLIILFFHYLFFYRNNIEFIKENRLVISAFVIYCFFLISSSLSSVFYLLSLESTLFYFRYGIFTLLIYFFLNLNSTIEKSIKYGLFYSLIFVLLNSNFQIIFAVDFFGNVYDGKRLSSVFGDEKILGDYFINFLPLLICLLLNAKNEKALSFIIILFILINSTLIVIYSGERAAFFYIISYLIFLFLFFPIKKKLFNVICFLLTIFSIIFIFNNQSIKERLINQTIRDFKITLNGEDNNQSKIFIFSQQHQYYYMTSINIFKDSNKILGSGPKTYREFCKIEKYKSFYDTNIVCSTSPHNYYIQALSETGITGFVILSSLFLYFFLQLFKINTENRILLFKYKSIIFIILTNIFPFLPSGSLFNNYFSLILFFNFSLFMYYKSKL